MKRIFLTILITLLCYSIIAQDIRDGKIWNRGGITYTSCHLKDWSHEPGWGAKVNGQLVVPCKYYHVDASGGYFFAYPYDSDNHYRKVADIYTPTGQLLFSSNEGFVDAIKLKTGFTIFLKGDNSIYDTDGSFLFNPHKAYISASSFIYVDNTDIVLYQGDNGMLYEVSSGRQLLNPGRKFILSEWANKYIHTLPSGKIYIVTERDDRYGLSELMTGKEIIAPRSKNRCEFIGDDYVKFYSFSDKYGVGLYDLKNEKVILEPEFTDCDIIGDNSIKFKLNGYWGVMSKAGKVYIPESRQYTKIEYNKTFKKFYFEKEIGDVLYKGECNANGVQTSITKVSAQKPTANTSNNTTKTSNNNTTASTSTSKKPAKEEPVEPGLLYKADYTISGLGTTNYETISIYEDRLCGTIECFDYKSTNSNGERIYKGTESFGAECTYYVSANYNIRLVKSYYNPYTAGYENVTFSVTKGTSRMPAQQGGNAPAGGNSEYQWQEHGTTTNPVQPHQETTTCTSCHGSGKCPTCNGKHWYYGAGGTKITCPNCTPNGACSSCGGSGKKTTTKYY